MKALFGQSRCLGLGGRLAAPSRMPVTGPAKTQPSWPIQSIRKVPQSRLLTSDRASCTRRPQETCKLPTTNLLADAFDNVYQVTLSGDVQVIQVILIILNVHNMQTLGN